MSSSLRDISHPVVKYGKTGVLIVNLGTPDSTSWWDIRKYLKEFLSDGRVIETNPILWWFVLNFLILNLRPHKTAKAYKKIWLQETDESPLRFYTRRQAEELVEKFKTDENIIVDYAMRYGNPSIQSKMGKMQKEGCERLVILPLYPQYAAATTATVCDEVYRNIMKMRWQPSLQIIPHYESEPPYAEALANSINEHLKKISWVPDVILSSYHGIPQKYFDKGDPYQCYCYKTNRLLIEKFGTQIPIEISFQSRFGPAAWLQPYTDKTLEKMAKEGKENVLMICPGFSSDCVETLEEIQIEGKEIFIENGGKNFSTVPCFNDSNDHINLLEYLIKKHLV